jgi:transcription initiation factor TFIID subunit 6
LKDKYRDLLINTIIETLRQLIDNSNKTGNDNEMDVEITDEEKAKLEKRCGKLISDKILEQEDAKKLVDAIFFGDLNE